MSFVDLPILVPIFALSVIGAGGCAGEDGGVAHGLLIENDTEHISDIHRGACLDGSVCAQIIGAGEIDLVGAVDILPEVNHFRSGQLENGVVVGVAENSVRHLSEHRGIEVSPLELLRGVPHDNAIGEIGVELDGVFCHQVGNGVDAGISPLHKVPEILRGIDS